MTYAAKIVADSIAFGVRLTTWELTFPRFILAEVNTHRMLSRNSASSRAIPVTTRISQVRERPFVPEQFLRNQPGMQGGDALDEESAGDARFEWLDAAHEATESAARLAKLEVHKQYANRVLEPYSWHTALITATETENLWNLRDHKDAQPEFQKIARMAREALAASTPLALEPSEWHLPYVDRRDEEQVEGPLRNCFGPEGRFYDRLAWETLLKVSVARCAAISFERQHVEKQIAQYVARHDQMRAAGHMSPFEHQAQVIEPCTNCLDLADAEWHPPFSPQYEKDANGEWQCFGYFCRNFRAPWLQYRATLPGERVFGVGR